MVEQAPATPTCPDCAAPHDAADNYCRNCGMFLPASRLPAPRPIVALEPRRPGLPAPVRRAATAIAIGAAFKITANIAGKLLAQRAAGKASGRALARRRERTVVSESLFVRRTWIERD